MWHVHFFVREMNQPGCVFSKTFADTFFLSLTSVGGRAQQPLIYSIQISPRRVQTDLSSARQNLRCRKGFAVRNKSSLTCLRPQLCIGAEERLSIDWGDSRICPVSVDKHFWACALIIGFRPRSRRLINRLCAHLTHTGCCFRYYCWFRSPINTHKPLTHIQSADVYANVASSACGKAAPAPFCNQTKFGLFADMITQSVLWLTVYAPTWVCLYNMFWKIFVYTVH